MMVDRAGAVAGAAQLKRVRHKHEARQATTAFLKAPNIEIINHNIPGDGVAAAAV